MANRVTIQDIADSLGVSRNTVSKAINNTGILAETTRKRILKKAVEMGYKQFSYLNEPEEHPAVPVSEKEVALITTMFPDSSHFAYTMLDRFQKELSQRGYGLTVYRVLSQEVEHLALPAAFDPKRVAGIVCIEMFNYDYCKMLCDLDIPTLMVDGPFLGANPPLKADFLSMNNMSCSCTFLAEMARRGKTEIGFIGDYHHCQSFFERYAGFHAGCFLSDLPIQEEYCLVDCNLDNPNSLYLDQRDYLRSGFRKLKKLPQVYLCANDAVAVDALIVLREMGLRVPEDIWLCGFDDSPISSQTDPPLTTIHIHTQVMGYTAARMLISRIRNPEMNYITTYAETDLIYRASTGDEKKGNN